MEIKSGLRWKGRIRIEKFAEGVDPATGTPYEVVECGNLALTAGMNEIWKLVTGQGGTAFTNANALIGIGDSTAAPAAGQTDLQAATNKTYIAMNGGYPTVPASGQVQFQATFGSAQANYAWNEAVVKNNTSGICLNRTTNGGTGFGTKVAGTTWTTTFTLSLS
ncbi:MAG: hypothetical protein M0Z75_12065 [Nitrospiraceae bacterium]|nr:hypothetical protein [Nitrospiraceae bacterium]